MIDINNIIKEALKSGNKEKLGVYRLIKAEFLKYESQGPSFKIGEKEEADILRMMIKQREKSIVEYQNSGRIDLVEIEKNEIEYISEFLPKEPSDDEIYSEIMTFMGFKDIPSIVLERSDMGRVMAYIKQKLPLASGKKVSDLVKSLIKN